MCNIVIDSRGVHFDTFTFLALGNFCALFCLCCAIGSLSLRHQKHLFSMFFIISLISPPHLYLEELIGVSSPSLQFTRWWKATLILRSRFVYLFYFIFLVCKNLESNITQLAFSPQYGFSLCFLQDKRPCPEQKAFWFSRVCFTFLSLFHLLFPPSLYFSFMYTFILLFSISKVKII